MKGWIGLCSLNMNKGRMYVRIYTKPLKNYAFVWHHRHTLIVCAMFINSHVHDIKYTYV